MWLISHFGLSLKRSKVEAKEQTEFRTLAQVCLNKAKTFMYEQQYTKLCIMNENECVYEAPRAMGYGEQRANKAAS